jgi:hypothetical protein
MIGSFRLERTAGQARGRAALPESSAPGAPARRLVRPRRLQATTSVTAKAPPKTNGASDPDAVFPMDDATDIRDF